MFNPLYIHTLSLFAFQSLHIRIYQYLVLVSILGNPKLTYTADFFTSLTLNAGYRQPNRDIKPISRPILDVRECTHRASVHSNYLHNLYEQVFLKF